MKKVSMENKEEFENINRLMPNMDKETRVYLLGYTQGLIEKRRISALLKKTKK